jgi:hypothetical protein
MANSAELSSVATAVDELATRITAMAEDASQREEDVAHDLYEVERALKAAARKLAKLSQP